MCLDRSRVVERKIANRNNDNNTLASRYSNENAMSSLQLDCSIDANVHEDSSSFYSCYSTPSLPSTSPSTSSSAASSSSAEESLYDQLAVMLQQEESGTYNCEDYISFLEKSNLNDLYRSPTTDDGIPIDVDCRNKMTQWCFQVIDFAKFKRSTVNIAMSYLDRFLSCHETCAYARRAISCRKYYQLACMTCLYMAIKMNEKSKNKNNNRSCSEFFINGRVFSDLSRNAYNTNDIMSMERKVLNTLQWRLNGPTSLEFLRYLLQVAVLPKLHEEYDRIERGRDSDNDEYGEALLSDNRNSSDRGRRDITTALLNIVDLCGFQLDLAVSDYFFVTQKQSTIAMAALLNALEVNKISKDSMNEAAKGNHGQESNDFLTRVIKELSLITNMDVLGPDVHESQRKLQHLLTNSGVKYQAQKQPSRGRCHQHQQQHEHDLHRRQIVEITKKSESSKTMRGSNSGKKKKAPPLSTIDVQIASSPICVSRVSRVVPRDVIAHATTTTIKTTNRRTIIHRSSAFQDSFHSQPQPRLQKHKYSS